MATADPAYDPALSGASPPVVIDGTGLASTVPLLIKTGKNNSGIEVQQTGSASPVFGGLDSTGARQVTLGYAVGAGDLVTTAAAGDAVLAGPPSGTKRLFLKSLASGGVVISSPTDLCSISVIDSLISLATSNVAITLDRNNSIISVSGSFRFSSTASLTFVSMGISGDANTGFGQIGGADTISAVAGGTEVWRSGNGTYGVFTKVTAPAAQQTSGANVTNNVTSGGTDDTIANYTDLTVYANDAAAIRNDIYQLARKVKQINDGLRLIGWFS